MTTLLQLQGGTKSFGARILFDRISFTVNENEHIGVIGPNGAGKTTLFKILVGQEDLEKGMVVRSNQLRLGYLEQEERWESNETPESYLSRVCSLPLWTLKSEGRKLGLFEEHWVKPIVSLSGGYRMRVKLLALIGQECNLLMLDEPTNYLDLETVLVLENFLLGYQGAFLLISHDREFLRRVTDHTLEIEAGDVFKYPGNIDDYFEQKELMRTQLEKRAMSLDAKREQIIAFAERFGAKASKAKQAQSRLKRLDKMETIVIKALPTSASIRIPEPIRTGQNILTLRDATLGYGQNPILKKVNVTLQRGDHVAVIGLNGAGKSTLLKTLAGELPLQGGSLEHGHNVSLAYFAQHVSERLRPNETVYEALARAATSDILRQDILDLAGSLLFSGDRIDRKISTLSGGEKSRVALGQILLMRAPCLVLDEPTNHLDFDTVEALTQALTRFPGSVVIVSHDRGFVSRVAKKIIEVRKGEAHVFPGCYDDYVWSLQQGILSERDGGVGEEGKNNQRNTSEAQPSVADWERKKELQRSLRSLEKNIKLKEEEVERLTYEIDVLTEKMNHAVGQEAGQIGKSLAKLQEKLLAAESTWMDYLEQREQLESDGKL